ncbi:MAG: sigma-70 family RNA polymerase sigma factor [Planctomycetota bacterium]
MKGEPTSNVKLVQEALEGSEAAFRELVATYGPALATFLNSYLKRREDIEEVVQTAFFRAFRRLDRLRSPEIFGSWLWRIAYCATVDLQRKSNRSGLDDIALADEAWLELPNDVPSVEMSLERQLLVDELQRRVHDLPPAMGQVLLLRYRDDWSYREIADHLDVSPVQVKARLARARQRLGAKTRDLAHDWRRLSDEMS